jgi:hypothetical protein
MAPILGVVVAITPTLRFAIFTVWPNKCVWCHLPLTFKEMEVDHLIPKSLTGDALVEALEYQALPSTYDLEAEENLAPSCGPCNGNKGKRIPPLTPGVSLLLADAAKRADEIRSSASSTLAKGKVEKLLGQLLAANLDDQATYNAITYAVQDLGNLLSASAPTISILKLTPATGIELGSDGAWVVSQFAGFGDCPNEVCYTGDINWREYPGDSGEIVAGGCYVCGTVAVRCPDCDSITGAYFDDFPCSGCGNTIELIRDRDSGDVESIIVTRPED